MIYSDYDVETTTKNKISNIVSNHKLYIQKYLNFSLGGEPCIDFDHDTFVK